MKKIILITVLLIPLVYSCKKESDSTTEPTMEEKARDGLYDLMKVMYY
jgi:hypothetical protein